MDDLVIGRAIMRIIFPLMLVLSVTMLLGHQYLPGGSIVGGLLAAAAMLLHLFLCGVHGIRSLLPIKYVQVAASGLLLMFLTAGLGLIAGVPFLTDLTLIQSMAGIGSVSMSILFHIGIYLTVFGTTTHMALLLAEEDVIVNARHVPSASANGHRPMPRDPLEQPGQAEHPAEQPVVVGQVESTVDDELLDELFAVGGERERLL